MKKIMLAATLMLFQLLASAQGADMADTMRSEGKIYVVIAVILVIFAGIILYLVRLDRKITRLEKQK
jgi:CcmD family protein